MESHGLGFPLALEISLVVPEDSKGAYWKNQGVEQQLLLGIQEAATAWTLQGWGYRAQRMGVRDAIRKADWVGCNAFCLLSSFV